MKHERKMLELRSVDKMYVAVINVYDDIPFDWSCYEGQLKNPRGDILSREDIAMHGDKILVEKARAMYPDLHDIPYRS